MEELQSQEKESSSKRKKQKLEILNSFAEADDNSNLEPFKEEMESDDDSEEENEMEAGSVKSEFNEGMKEELEDNIEPNDSNIKMEKEEDDNVDQNQEHGWHHDEDDDDDSTYGDKSSQEILVKPDIGDDITTRCERNSVQASVKKEEKEGKFNESSFCTECGESFLSVRSLADHVKAAHTHQIVPSSSHSGEEHQTTSADAKDTVTSNEHVETPFDTTTAVNCEACIDEGKPTKIYKNCSQLQIHFTNWHEFGTYLCDTCGESFKLI